MAKDLNKAMIIGNLTRDPELRTTPNGQSVASFGVATNRQWKNANGEQQEQVEFHDVVVWGKLAEICHQYLKKGGRAYFEGRLQTQEWEAQDGSKRRRTEIVAQDMILLGGRGDGGAPGAAPAPAAGMNQTPTKPTEAEASQVKDNKAGPKDTQAKGTKEDSPQDTALDDIPF